MCFVEYTQQGCRFESRREEMNGLRAIPDQDGKFQNSN
jgi:hypothetical protein